MTNKQPTVGMVALGCPKNLVDAEQMLASLREAGFTVTAECENTDAVIINTCGFIEEAKTEAIENILELAELKKEGKIGHLIVTGCLAQRYGEELCRELPECDAVVGLGANRDIAAVVRQVLAGDGPAPVTSFPELSCWELSGKRVLSTPPFFAYLRIGDGCDNCCTYCAIPLIRGRMRSRTVDDVVAEARQLAENGVKEVILVAQDTTLFGTDRGAAELPELLDRLCEIEGLHWIRMLYCYPEHITDALLDTMARQEKVVPYLDVPIQHVSGRVLRAMNRTGDRETLTALFRKIRARVPGVILRTTVMTGFPGETEEDVTALCEFMKEIRFERLGCFAYSAEEGTVAAELPDQVPEEEKQRRRDTVMETQTRVADAWCESTVGETVEVLVEGFDRYAECWFGRSAADAPDVDPKVFFSTAEPVHPGDFVQVKLTDRLEWDRLGERV